MNACNNLNVKKKTINIQQLNTHISFKKLRSSK